MMDQFTFLKDAYCNIKETIVIVDSAALWGGNICQIFLRLGCHVGDRLQDATRRGGKKKTLHGI